MKSYLHVLGCGCLVGAVILCLVIAFRESHPEFSSIAARGIVCLWLLLTTGLGLLAAGSFLRQDADDAASRRPTLALASQVWETVKRTVGR